MPNMLEFPDHSEANKSPSEPLKSHKNSMQYRNFPKFSDRQVWANSADPEQSDQGLHCLQFPLHPLECITCITLRKRHLV